MFVSILSYHEEISREGQLFAAHKTFVESQVQAGALLCSGPRLDAAGGLMVVYGEDEEATRRLLDSDPFVADGVATYELYPFKVGLADPASSLAAGEPAR